MEQAGEATPDAAAITAEEADPDGDDMAGDTMGAANEGLAPSALPSMIM